MEGLPKLPGLSFENPLKLNYHVPHSFDIINGYVIPKVPTCGIGGEPRKEESIAFVSKNSALMHDPCNSCIKRPFIPPFVPHFVLYDKKVLTFKAFFKQAVPESQIEHYRVRFVNIIYFLQDDSITVIEPEVKNSGIPQGRIVRRGKIAKNIKGECYTWKDFNIGIDIEINGIVFHITDCDAYTREFLLSQGIELNETETPPIDPVTTERMIDDLSRLGKFQRPDSSAFYDDKLRRFLEFQGKVLQFDCILDETDRPEGECLSYKLFYYLEDDTISIKELKENQEGRDRFPMMLRKTKLPKNWKHRPINFPSIYLETSDNEIQEYYSPIDLKVGETIFVFGRRFLLLDCDRFTREYYENILKMPQKEKLLIRFPKTPARKRDIPKYLGLGTPEDSMASCYTLVPKPPRKDIIKYLLNTNKYLRYGCVLDTAHPEDKIRKFVLSYSLADDTITIHEPPIRNSGILGGRFLAATRVKIPECNPDDPIYYSPKDFYIGAILKIFNHRFQITTVDLFVYRYMQENPEYFTVETVQSIRNYLISKGSLTEDEKNIDTKIDDAFSTSAQVSDMEKCLQVLKLHDSIKKPKSSGENLQRNEKSDNSNEQHCKIVPEMSINNEYPNLIEGGSSTAKSVKFSKE